MRFVVAASALLAASAALAAEPALEQRFREPSQSARPRVWWHWIDGNVTREGITRDLEWMQRSGFAGFQMFDVGRGYPALVERPVTFMSPEWKELLRYSAAEADRLGLEMTMASSAGWSETGGPGVTPEAAMKKLVWSETRIAGGQRFAGSLAAPPSSNGPFLDMAIKPPFQINGEPKATIARPTQTHYADTRVVAYRVPVPEVAPVAAKASAGTVDLNLLRDDHYDAAFVLPVAGDALEKNWVQFDFGQPVTIRSLRLGIRWPQGNASGLPEGRIEAGDDGAAFRPVAPLPAPATAAGLPIYTLALPETRARYFRVLVRPGGAFTFPGLPPREIREFQFTEMAFSAAARPHRFELKAAFAVARDYDALAAPAPVADAAIAPDGVVDVTDRMQPDGTLDWTPPPGDWSVIRFGAALTGAINSPATQAATGFEVDKYSAAEVRHYLDQYFGPILSVLGPLQGRRGLRAVLTDSFEAGSSNWTPALLEEFRARRGYDPTPYLPVLADHVVGSAELSDRFLWDFRRTLADLLSEKHYGTVANYAKSRGLGYYGEAMGVDWPTTGDGLQAKRHATVPMGEFWQVPADKPSGGNHVADIREAASAAHVYGQNLVASESFTSFPLPATPAPYTNTPWLLKPLADRFMALGVNRFIVHTAVHQPLEQGPGLTLAVFGQFFSRHETWAGMARGWTDYLARSSELLQQGRYAADIAYFYGEGAAVAVPDGAATDPAMPAGYGFDFVCRDMLLQDFSIKAGRLVAKSGMSYSLLVLPASTTRITVPLARRLRDLVAAGLTLAGPRPRGGAGAGDDDAEIAKITGELWGDLDGQSRTTRAFGKGRVYWGVPLADVLSAQKRAPDFTFAGAGAAGLVALHRARADGEIYFVANQANAPARVDASLRVTGREAQLWHADDGRIEPASFRREDNRTVVPLTLAPYEAVFVVLRKATKLRQRTVPEVRATPLATVEGAWEVGFPPDRGAPASVHLDRLASWSESAEPGLRYFAGTGSYKKTFDVPAAWLQAPRVLLDLGEVHELAQVWVNGREAGIAWKPPYRVDVTHLLRPGRNELRIDVANLWANRFIGDRQPGAGPPRAFSTYAFFAPSLVKLPYTQDTPLLPSGLIGPVQVLAEDHR